MNHRVGLWFEPHHNSVDVLQLLVIVRAQSHHRVCHLRGEFIHSYFLQLADEVFKRVPPTTTVQPQQ